MTPKSLRVAYAMPLLVAVVLAFLAMVQLDQRGVVGADTTVTAIEAGPTWSNARTAASLERAAARTGATLVRTIADRHAPASRRTLLTTTAEGSLGDIWESLGYRNFDRGITTTARPISDLERFDPVGDYQVFGDARAAEMFTAVFENAGYDVSVTGLRSPTSLALEDGVGGARTLLMIVVIAGAVLCLIGTVGSPRRMALSSLSGCPVGHVVIRESTAIRSTVATTAIAAPAVLIGLAIYNGCAMIGDFATTTAVFAGALLIPTAVTHGAGALASARLPIAAAVRGQRPAGFVVGLAALVRVPVSLLLVTASFAAVGSTARATDGSTARDLRAAGDTVQLWVSSDRSPDTDAPWQSIGRMARDALRSGDAFLAAPFIVSNASEKHEITGMYIDQGYLDQQRVRGSNGAKIHASADTITVWIPSALVERTPHIIDLLSDWELRDAAIPMTTGVLADGQDVYTYPDDRDLSAWTGTTVLIVVPSGSEVLSDDYLGALVSSGDVVFRNEGAALRAIHTHHLDKEFSAVVSVGQVAADTARQQAVAARVDVITAVAALLVAALVMALATVVHRRRFGTTVFTRHAAGWPFMRSNRALLGIEAAVLAGSVLAALSSWAERAPESSGAHSTLDPAALSAPIGAAVACGAALLITGTSVIVLAVTGRRAVQDHGKET